MGVAAQGAPRGPKSKEYEPSERATGGPSTPVAFPTLGPAPPKPEPFRPIKKHFPVRGKKKCVVRRGRVAGFRYPRRRRVGPGGNSGPA